MGSLGKVKQPNKRAWFLETEPPKEDDVNPIKDVIDNKDIDVAKPIKDFDPVIEVDDDVEILVTYRINRDIVVRLYSEMFWDPERRAMKDVVSEILEEGLKKRPFKGPAPAAFIASLKSRGKRKKS